MRTILVIEDDTAYADMLQLQLKALGHNVAEGRSLRESHDLVARFAPEVILLDVCLPDGSGLEKIQALKSARCMPEVIVITGAGNAEDAEIAIRSGAFDYWQKGRPLKTLVQILEKAGAYREARSAGRGRHKLERQNLLGESQEISVCIERIAEASASDVPVLIRGETGTGKEVAARLIHRNSARDDKPFVTVDCASLTESLAESTLFGHHKGAFTGANGDRPGLVRRAHQGTLFLDEIGELPPGVQKAFLRVLQQKRFRPVGSDAEVESDFRLVAATHRDLGRMVGEGSFREDLYYRLRALEIVVPPLRSRGADAAAIADEVAATTCERLALPPKHLSSDLRGALMLYPWPGNVRELRQAIECAVVTAGSSPVLESIHLPIQIRIHLARAEVRPELNLLGLTACGTTYPTLASARDAAVRSYLERLWADVRGNVDRACAHAGVSRSRLYELLKDHRIERPSSTKSPALLEGGSSSARA